MGKFSILDVVKMVSIIHGAEISVEDLELYDIDGNGTIDVRDVMAVVNSILFEKSSGLRTVEIRQTDFNPHSPDYFQVNQSDLQCFYWFENVYVDGKPSGPDTYIGMFKNGVCVGYQDCGDAIGNMNIPVCAMGKAPGQGAGEWDPFTIEYLEPNEVPDRIIIWDRGFYYEVPAEQFSGKLDGFQNLGLFWAPSLYVTEGNIIKPVR